ncbi:Peptidyl-prolyl cis-trans isomerase B [Blattella germanica]|nr:Peptidyl-prolyl cis-trans isomerase B [Blattella germanica]
MTGNKILKITSAALLLFVAFSAIQYIFGSMKNITLTGSSTIDKADNKYKVTDRVYFDVSIDGESAGRIIIGLFGDVVPKTVKNFKTIASEGINGGDIENGDGTGSISIYGKNFPDENFDIKHTAPGFLSMANAVATSWLDGHHTVFGKVIEGQNIVHKIEQLKTNPQDQPLKPVIITASGLLETSTPFYISDDPYE